MTTSLRTGIKVWARRVSILSAAGAMALGMFGCEDKQKKAMQEELNSVRQQNDQLAQQNKSLSEQMAMMQTKGDASDPYSGTTAKAAKGSGGGTVITIAGDVLFDAGKTTIKPTAKPMLNKIAGDLNSKYSSHNVRIEGYTDTDPIKKSKWANNEALSAARAEAVEQYLSTHGVDGTRMSSVGKGAANPKGSKPASRRVEIVVVGGN